MRLPFTLSRLVFILCAVVCVVFLFFLIEISSEYMEFTGDDNPFGFLGSFFRFLSVTYIVPYGHYIIAAIVMFIALALCVELFKSERADNKRG